MNKLIKKIKWMPIGILMGLLMLVSCEKYLDKAPQADISNTEAFKNFKNFQGFTEELYNCIPMIIGCEYHSSWNYGEEEYWEQADARIFANQIDRGNFLAWNSAYYSWFKTSGDYNYTYSQERFDKGRLWGLSWYAIYKANVGIANLDKLTEANEEQKKLIEGQLLFFRGWFHFMLMQYWGGLPYIDWVISPTEVFSTPRLNYQATADKVAQDIQRAADLLPISWDSIQTGKEMGNNNIRINKVMALAYLGKNLLWAGSPLMNYESTGSSTYNIEYCRKAADVFGEVLKICHTTGRYQLAPFANYTELFYTYNKGNLLPGLKEAIFYENIAESQHKFRWNQVNDYRPPTIHSTGIKVYPTANYADYYGMANGLPITDPVSVDLESGYNPEYPWRDRDPRFYHDFIIDGTKCCLNSAGNLSEQRQYASLYTGGHYRTADATRSVQTGYMNSKFTSKLLNEFDGYRDNNCMVLSLMRLADVFLMYGEATSVGYGSPQSIATGSNMSAVNAVDSIRIRAGVGKVADKFLGSTEDFLSEVRRERAVELAFEGHRFVDLRRWMLLLQKPYTVKTAIEFDRAGDVPNSVLYQNPQNGRVLNYRHRVLLERQFTTRHYWFPFLNSDVRIYPEFKQNPGW